MTALQAQTQMDPGITCFDAVLANMFVCAGDANLIQMTALRHSNSQSGASDFNSGDIQNQICNPQLGRERP